MKHDNKSEKPRELEKELIQACREDLAKVRYLLTTYPQYLKANMYDGIFLSYAIEAGNFDVLKYLLTSPEIERAGITDNNNHAVHYASLCGRFEMVKYLLTSLELTEKAWVRGYDSPLLQNQPDSIRYLDKNFTNACQAGNIALVDYLLRSPELAEHCSIYAQNNLGFRNACKYGHVKLVEYLLNYPGFKTSEGIIASLGEGVIVSYHNEHPDITHYLLEFIYSSHENSEHFYKNSYLILFSHEGPYRMEGISKILKDFPQQAVELCSIVSSYRLSYQLNKKTSLQLYKL